MKVFCFLPIMALACAGFTVDATPAGVPTSQTQTRYIDNVEKQVEPMVKMQAFPFKTGQVRLLPGPFQHAQEMDRKYLLSLDPDRLLAPFYEAAGLKPKKPRYGGWESKQISGHILGHWLSGASRMAAVTGDNTLKRRVDYAVSELSSLQEKSSDGYVCGFPETPFQTAFTGNFTVIDYELAGHWVPWYTMHKIMAGLLDAYEISGNRQALEVAKKLGDWAKRGTDKLTEKQFQRMLLCEHGGIAESLAELYSVTGERRFLALAKRFTDHRVLDPLSKSKDKLSGLHANTQVPKLTGAARIYELTGDRYYRDAALYFWKEVIGKRSYAFGGNSIGEHFSPLGTEPLGATTAETCNTHNMLRLTKKLMAWSEDSELADYYELALYNHILASQDPDTGMPMYFYSTRPGHFKVYSTPFDSMWCCTGTGLENPARTTEAVYFHNEETLWVNLYLASELRWDQKGLVLRQETAFPEAPESRLKVVKASAEELEFKFRIPSWAAGPVVVSVNGKQKQEGKEPGWITVKRRWKKGDVVEISLPMGLHLRPSADDPAKIAVLYGPIVLAAEAGRKDFPSSDQFMDQNEPNDYPAPLVPVLVSSNNDPAAWLKPVKGKKLTFKTAGGGRPTDMELIPLYKLHHQRYTVYLHLVTPQQWKTEIRSWGDEPSALASWMSPPAGSPSVTWRVRAGGDAYRDKDRKLWAAEKGYLGGTPFFTDRPLLGIKDAELYRGERWGADFSYIFPVPPGSYRVRLKFMETYAKKRGERMFDVSINGKKVLENFDIIGEAGGPDKAVDRTFSGIAPDLEGLVKIRFRAKVQSAKVCAIEIVQEQ
jgi:DUF1680 family protein